MSEIKIRTKIITCSILFGLVLGLIDAVFDYLTHNEGTLLEEMVFNRKNSSQLCCGVAISDFVLEILVTHSVIKLG